MISLRLFLAASSLLFATQAIAAVPTQPAIEVPLTDKPLALFGENGPSDWIVHVKTGPVATGQLWTMTNGALSFENGLTGYLRTTRSFTNYHLHVEWRWPGKIGNSGVFVHENDHDTLWPFSIQIQLKADASGDLIAQGGMTFANGATTISKQRPSNEKTPGEWNRCDIDCRSDGLWVYINGELQNKVTKLPATAGFVALQLEGTAIEFRNVSIQSLSSPTESSSDLSAPSPSE